MNTSGFSSRNLLILVSLLGLIAATGCSETPRKWEPAYSQYSEYEETPELTLVWEKFRRKFPFHTQTLALMSTAQSGTYNLIIAEPPPHISLEELAHVAPAHIQKIETRQHPIGHDGWVKDVVALVTASKKDLEGVLAKTSELLFGTSYKAYYLDLSADLITREEPYPIDLSVSSRELIEWVIDGVEPFVSDDGGQLISLSEITSKPASGVFFSNRPGLVGLWLPKSVNSVNCHAEIRRFTLDSDVIVGAISDTLGVLVLGRERQVPLDVLPPLRTETVILLDAAGVEQLAQSYERNHLMAGPLKDEWDWAPIYLSPELVNTEYGSVLNITDQMLKGWSNNGLTRYLNFDYPDPPKWPFKSPLPRQLGASEVTYNWNTSGVGYVVPHGDFQAYALNRTGALPVSYIPGEAASEGQDAVLQAEDAAYEYFAKLNDPYLVRVVQYAALYQIFTAFRGDAPKPSIKRNEEPQEDLFNRTIHLLEKAMSIDEATLKRAISHATGRFHDEAADTEFVSEVMSTFQVIRHAIAADPEGVVTGLLNPQTEEDRIRRYYVRLVLNGLASLDDIPKRYAASQEGGRWIHTPVVVVSKLRGELAGLVGGHNLRSGVSRFHYSNSVKPGELRILEENGKSIYVMNPIDQSKQANIVRTVGRDWGSTERTIRQATVALRQSKPTAVRTMNAALQRPPPSASGTIPKLRGFDPAADSPGIGRVGRWGKTTVELPADDISVLSHKALQQRSANGLILERRDASYQLVYGEKNAAVELYTMEDATDSVVGLISRSKPGEPVLIELRGFAPHEAEGLLQTTRIRTASLGQKGETFGVIPRRGMRMGDVQQLTRTRLDFPRAKITGTTIENAGRSLNLTLEIPQVAVSKPSLLVRIRLFFDRVLSNEAITLLQTKVAQLVERVMGRSSDLLDLNLQLRRELRILKRQHGTDLKRIEQSFGENLDDVYIVQNHENWDSEDDNATRSRAA